MPELHSRKRDLFAIALLAVCLFLVASLVTYYPADMAGIQSTTVPVKPSNACGRGGVYAAEGLFRLFGWSAYFFVGSLLAFDIWLLARRPVNDPILRLVGWLMAVMGIATFLALAGPATTPGPVIGPGGYLGAGGRALLEINFASAGAFILTVSFVLGGALLCTDYFLFRALAFIFLLPLFLSHSTAGRILHSNAATTKSRRKNKSCDDAASLAVRIRGKRVDKEVEAADSDDKQEEQQESEAAEPVVKANAKKIATDEDAEGENEEVGDQAAQDDANSGKPGIGARLASALRIRNLRDADRQVVMQELEAAANSAEEVLDYELPPLDLLLPGESVHLEEHEKEVRQKAKLLEKTFESFGFKVKVVEIETGPVIAQYEVELEAGLRLSKITGLADDLAIALRVPSVRIVAPIPGKNTVGIEVPNNDRQLVRLREVIEETGSRNKKMRIPIFLGKDVAGNPMVVDLAALPHLLIAGRTGTGKSVCLNTIIVSMLMTRSPNDVRMLMIDPKMVELSPYKKLPHLMHPVVTDMRKAEAILAWAVEKMEERYALLARAGVRHVSVYNQLGEEELMDRLQPEGDEERAAIPRHLPYIVIVADEIADMMMTSGKEVEQHIIRLAQKSRAVGIHLVLATQKPTVDVITGLIKSNLPARIAFQVSSRTDSRVVLDEMGADKLLGNGDMLVLLPGTSTLLRGQGTYVSDDEINKVLDHVGTSEQQFVTELVQLKPAAAGGEADASRFKNRDELYEQAIDIVIREGRGSVSLLQRSLGIGYGRAARLIDFMAEDGIVGQYNGSQAREILLTLEQWAQMSGQHETQPESAPFSGAMKSAAFAAAGAIAGRKRNCILPESDAADELDEVERDEFDDESGRAEDEDAADADAEFEDELDDDETPWDDEESNLADEDEGMRNVDEPTYSIRRANSP
ncbi:MAG: DNA translocase FtsK [Pirellulales bacterium]|nr:DNA translocase FtsK [Pirellulales bacterium]